MSINSQVERFVTEFLKTKPEVVTAGSISTMFIDQKVADEWGPIHDDAKQGCYLGIQQIVRPLLRHLDEVAEKIESGQLDLDLPEEMYLQDMYSMACVGIDAYVAREALTREQMEAIVARDRKLSKHFAKRADALESWWHRANPQAPLQ